MVTVYVLGAPGWVGGAGTELWDTLRWWCRGGFDVHLVRPEGFPKAWRKPCEEIGCTIHETPLRDVPGMAGSNVTAFCAKAFLESADELRAMGCRLIWVSCMTYVFKAEREHYETHGPFDVYVCQSRFQRALLREQLAGYQLNMEHIPGAFCIEDWPFAPASHQPGQPFVLGRLSRADADKFSSNTWPIWEGVSYGKKEGHVMGWQPEKVQKKLGKPPGWVKTYRPGEMPAKDFHRMLHALVQINGGAKENWPRVGLEAMATGDVLVAQNQWGWKEMVEDGRTGFLCSSDRHEISHRIATLAWDESLRCRMAVDARQRVEQLADPEPFIRKWRTVLT